MELHHLVGFVYGAILGLWLAAARRGHSLVRTRAKAGGA